VIHDAIYCGRLGINSVVRRGICHGLLGDNNAGRDGADDLHEFERQQADADEQLSESDVHVISGVAATIAGTNCGAGSYTLQPGSATAAGGSFYKDVNGPAISTVSIISAGTGDRFSCERGN
jgi:hypothetical protein